MSYGSDNQEQGQTAGTGSHAYSHSEATYLRKKRRQLVEEQEMGELNIVPYLDIMVNLIMFLLVTQATMVSLGVIDVTAPSYAPAGPGADGKSKVDPQADLKLTVGVSNDGYYIAAKGGVLGDANNKEEVTEQTKDGVAKQPPTIPLANGQHDYAALSRKLRGIKTVFPKAVAVYLAADQNIPYQVIVKTLDASRSDDQGELFPAVAFSRLR
ncbi:MAG: biopolymer transporter ExbD [Myxococcota bacterium]|nr:biopolymer transporter ExbD [Myxococcota bacterium]